MKKKTKKTKEKTISNIQVLKNCLFAVRELAVFSKLYIIVIPLLTLLYTVVSAFESTYYIKMIVSALENGEPFEKIALLIIIFIGLQFVLMCADWSINIWSDDIVENRFRESFNRRLFRKAANVELECYENPEFYDKYTRALSDTCSRIFDVFYNFVWIAFESIKVVYLIATMMAIDAGVGIFLVFPIIGNFLLGKWLNGIEQERYKENTRNTRIRDYVMRTLHLARYAKEIRLTSVYSLIQRQHAKSVDDTGAVYDKYAFKSGAVNWIKVQFTFTLIFEGLLVYCAYKALVHGTISLADMTVLTSVMSTATWGVINISDSILNIQNQCIYLQNAREFMSYKEKIPEDGDGIAVPEKIESIEFRNVTFTYKGETTPTLDGVSFALSPGEHVALVGRNGAGKSTLVKLLLRLYDPDSGEILLNGRNIKEYRVADYRRAFSTAFQDYQVLAMSLFENMTMGAKNEGDRQRAEKLLCKVGLSKKLESLDRGLDTVLTREFDDSGEVLSGGEAQKLAVARALMKKGAAYVFDEPSSALDPISEYELFNTVIDETAGTTTLIISHRLSSAKLADRIIVLDGGKICESGTHSEMMRRRGLYYEMFVSQARNYLADDEIGGEAI